MGQSKLGQDESRRGSHDFDIVSGKSGSDAIKGQLFGNPKLNTIPSFMITRVVKDVVVLIL